MELILPPASPADAAECGRICFEAFATIADQHNFPRDILTVGLYNEPAGAFLPSIMC
jgi:hypothetical protein